MKKSKPPKDNPKRRKETAKPKAGAGNTRLNQQTRKLLGKHYASNYRVR